MTTPVPADPSLDAPSLIGTGMQTMVHEARRLGLSWQLVLGTVTNVETSHIVCDGDTQAIMAVSMIGTIYAGQRVYVMQVPPSGNFIVGSVVPQPEYEWETWNPQLFNWTRGNGTTIARYKKIGKTVTIYFRFQMGTGSAIGSSPNFTLPFELLSIYNDESALPFGGELRDSLTTARQAHIAYGNNLQIIVNYWNATPAPAQTTATAPWVWAINDRITVWGTYETT